MNITITSRGREVEVIERRQGQIMNEQGYMEPTYNIDVVLGHELDDDGNRTGRLIACAGNNAESDEMIIDRDDAEVWMIDPSRALSDWLSGWADTWVDQFRTEGVLG